MKVNVFKFTDTKTGETFTGSIEDYYKHLNITKAALNKQEAIEKIKSEKKLGGINSYGLGYNEALDEAIYIVKQLDEPEKPVVPQFVADWYEDNKDDFEYNVYFLCVKFYENELKEEIKEWFNSMDNKPIETLVDMHKFGYEIEKEKLYEVFLKRNGAQLGVCIPDGEDKAQFTETELKEFEFDNSHVYEVKEVEE